MRISVAMRAVGLLAASALAGGGSAAGTPAPPNSVYFTQCLEVALQAKAVSRNGPLLQFACYGETAEWFYNALGRRPPDVLSEKTYGDDTYRFVDHVGTQADDMSYCRRAARAAVEQQYACMLLLPAGSFLDR